MTESRAMPGLRGRGEAVADGVWRLRLPLPFGVVPHGNAWALAAGEGIVLVDCGAHVTGSLDELERALGQIGFELESVRLLVCTHAHPDHYGQAASVVARAGCELWMHPRHQHTTAALTDPDAVAALRGRVARENGVPSELVPDASELNHLEQHIAGVVTPSRALANGVVVQTDGGDWEVVETPGHAPSHVCLLHRRSRTMITGDHLLPRVALHFEYGFSPDPLAEFLASLNTVHRCEPSTCLPGHGSPFGGAAEVIAETRRVPLERLRLVAEVLDEDEGLSAFDVMVRLLGGEIQGDVGRHALPETLTYLRHLQLQGRAIRERVGARYVWSPAP